MSHFGEHLHFLVFHKTEEEQAEDDNKESDNDDDVGGGNSVYDVGEIKRKCQPVL